MATDKNAPGRFEFVVTAGARARQLLNGSTPRVEVGDRKKTTIALQEVRTKVVQKVDPATGDPDASE